jgi:hypothetical protein
MRSSKAARRSTLRRPMQSARRSISAAYRDRAVLGATSGRSNGRARMFHYGGALYARTCLRIAAAALSLQFAYGCVQTHVSSADRETLKQIIVTYDQSSVTIGAAGATNPLSGAVGGFATGALGGAAALFWAGPLAMAGGAAVFAPVGLWHGAACGLAMRRAEIEDPVAAFKQLYEKSVEADTFRQAVVDRLKTLIPPPSKDFSAADAVLEIRKLRVSLSGSFGTCEPTLSGFVEWRVTRTADEKTIARSQTTLRQPLTAKNFKDAYADESTAAAEIKVFVNALGAAVANDALGKK